MPEEKLQNEEMAHEAETVHGEEAHTEGSVRKEEHTESSVREEKQAESPVREEKQAESPVREEKHTESPVREEKYAESPRREERTERIVYEESPEQSFFEEEPKKRKLFRRNKEEAQFQRDKWILSKIRDEDLMDYLVLEQKRNEQLQKARDIREKRIISAFKLTVSLAAGVTIVYLLKDNPTIFVNILYIGGILGGFWFWKSPREN